MRRSSRHKWIWIAAAALALSLLAAGLAWFQVGPPSLLTGAAETVSRPFHRLFSPLTHRIQQGRAWFEDQEALLEENAALREQVEVLKIQAASGRLARQENQRLRSLLGTPAAQRLTLEPAWVIARTPDTWQRSVTLNKGADHGAAPGQCVVDAHSALVGRVSEVGETWCRVTLLTDPAAQIPGLGTTSGVLATVTGDLSRMPRGEAALTGLTQDDPVSLGESLVTFSAGDTCPSGLLIGTLTALTEDPGGLTQSGAVTPAAHLEDLREVFLVTDFWEDF